MNKHHVLPKIFAFACMATLIISGILVPSILLHRQDSSLIGQTQMFKPSEQEPLSISSLSNAETDIDAVTSEYDELVYRMSAWDDASQIYVREPYSGEWEIDEAVDHCVYEIISLVDNGVLFFINPDDFVFNNAVLYTKKELISTDIAQWEMEFTHNVNEEYTISVWMDANTGVLYSIEITCNYHPNNIQSLLKGYAEFYGISVQDKDDGMVMSVDNNILIQGTISEVSSSEQIYKIWIEMLSKNL